VAHGVADLEELMMKLCNEHAALKAQGIELVVWGPDAESNTVMARMADYTPERAQALQDKYGGSSWITVKPWVGPRPRRV
jgi:hypothetical protein